MRTDTLKFLPSRSTSQVTAYQAEHPEVTINFLERGYAEHQLHDAILRGKKVSDEMIQTSQREAQMLVREAEMTAERMVGQAAERAAEVESRIAELRMRRKELQLKFKSTLELFGQILDAEMEDERTAATVHTLPRRTKTGA